MYLTFSGGILANPISITIIMVYMTSNNQTFKNHILYMDELAKLEKEIVVSQISHKYVLVIGDLNTTLDAIPQSQEPYKTKRQIELNKLLEKMNLVPISHTHTQQIHFTYHMPLESTHTRQPVTSRIDHALISNNFREQLHCNIVEHHEQNDGNHLSQLN